MPTIRIERKSLEDVERALDAYRELIASLERDRTLTPSTAKTYFLHADHFVRGLRREFEPGKRNQSS